ARQRWRRPSGTRRYVIHSFRSGPAAKLIGDPAAPSESHVGATEGTDGGDGAQRARSGGAGTAKVLRIALFWGTDRGPEEGPQRQDRCLMVPGARGRALRRHCRVRARGEPDRRHRPARSPGRIAGSVASRSEGQARPASAPQESQARGAAGTDGGDGAQRARSGGAVTAQVLQIARFWGTPRGTTEPPNRQAPLLLSPSPPL